GPVDGLLGENAGMFKAGGADVERELLPVDLPFLRQLFVVLPPAAAFGGAVVHGVGLRPQGRGLGVFPDDLRVGANQQSLAPALQPVVVGGVQQLVIPQGIGRAHKRCSFPIVWVQWGGASSSLTTRMSPNDCSEPSAGYTGIPPNAS